jgi:hypothetical protein
MPNAEVAVGKRRAPALASSGKFCLLGGGREFEGFSIALDTNCIGGEYCVSTALVRSTDHCEDQERNVRLSLVVQTGRHSNWSCTYTRFGRNLPSSGLTVKIQIFAPPHRFHFPCQQ